MRSTAPLGNVQIQTNTGSLFAQRRLAMHAGDLGQSLQRLSSGLRINSAKDDAAGLAIGERMQAQLRGMRTAVRNANDAVSMLQVAEGAMASVGDSLQRIRELAVQAANGTNGVGDCQALNAEAQELAAAINQTASNTEFNGKKIFSQSTIQLDHDRRALLHALKGGWLEQAENRIREYFGIQADGATLTFDLDSSVYICEVTSSGSDDFGRSLDQKLEINMQYFTPPWHDDREYTETDGPKPYYGDLDIAHELVHAVMGRGMNYAALPDWFKEGAAILICGGDVYVGALGNDFIIDNRSCIFEDFSWSIPEFAIAGAAARYMHQRLKEMGAEGGIKTLMMHLQANLGETLDAALNAVSSGAWGDTAAFQADFESSASADYISGMDFSNADVGALGGLDADGGPELNAEDVIQDGGTKDGDDVLVGFNEKFPELVSGAAAERYTFQVGPNPNQTITASLPALNAAALGIADIDLADNAQFAIAMVDAALDFLNAQRSRNGATNNRLEAAIQNLRSADENLAASRSRLIDADYAEESARLSRTLILQDAAMALLAEANMAPKLVLKLLR